mgnify:FL=1
MKLDAMNLGMATAIVFAAVWALCSLLVVALPGTMTRMSGHMLHADLAGYGWTIHWTGFLVGLVLWSVLGGLLVWGVAAVYNRMVS